MTRSGKLKIQSVLVRVDHKSTSKKEEPSLEGGFGPSYKRQIEAHGFDGGNIRIADESMDECVADDRWRIEETDYFAVRSGRWTRLSASATKRFDGKSDGASSFAAALLVPAEPVAESITLRTSRKPKSPAKELVVALGSSATSHAVAAALADALGLEIPRKRRRPRASVPETVWPRCNPRVSGLSESSQSAA